MGITPQQLYDSVVLTVDKQQSWVEALIFEKLGFNWGAEVLAAGEHDIFFQQPYANADTEYDVSARVFATDPDDGEDISFVLKERHETYFKVWVDKDCVFSYFTINPKIALTL
jgi:hypothetical protein